MANTDPPDFADVCRLLFTVRIGGAEFPADVPALDAWMAARQWPDDTIASYQKARRKAVEAFTANDGSDALSERIEELHRIVHMLRAQPLARQGAKRGQKLSEFASKGNKARRKYTRADRDKWLSMIEASTDLQRLRDSSKRECAKHIATIEGLPPEAAETIRKAI